MSNSRHTLAYICLAFTNIYFSRHQKYSISSISMIRIILEAISGDREMAYPLEFKVLLLSVKCNRYLANKIHVSSEIVKLNGEGMVSRKEAMQEVYE